MTRYAFLLLSLLIPYTPSLLCFASDVTPPTMMILTIVLKTPMPVPATRIVQHGGKCSLADRFSPNSTDAAAVTAEEVPFVELECPLTCQNKGACRHHIAQCDRLRMSLSGRIYGRFMRNTIRRRVQIILSVFMEELVSLSTELIQSFTCQCPPGFDGSPACTLNPNHVQPTVTEKLEEEAIRFEFLMLLSGWGFGLCICLCH